MGSGVFVSKEDKMPSNYWSNRKHSLYYRAVAQIVAVVGHDASSIIDVGSANTDYVKWFGWIPRKVQLNRGFNSELEGVERIATDFFTWAPEKPFDVAMCLQVVEHIVDARGFCQKLKETGKKLVISVPYKWPAGHPDHVQDPVDEDKIMSWMDIPPNYSLIVREPFGSARIICYYDIAGGPKTRFTAVQAKEILSHTELAI